MLEGRRALEQIRDVRTGEIWVESGQVIDEEVAEHIASSDLSEIHLLIDPKDPLILNSLKEDAASNHEEALSAIYAKLRPGNPVQIEKARELLNDRFFNEARYSLGKVGRFRINKKLGLDIADDVRVLTREDIISIIKHSSGVGIKTLILHYGKGR